MPVAPVPLPPRAVPQQFRPPRHGIPPALAERRRILQVIRNYVSEFNPVPPLPLGQLAEHTGRVVTMLQCDPAYRDYIGVLINNEIWREALAAVPYERRLLLLPKCLRNEAKCPAPFDEFGLLCKHCGLCSIQDLQTEAERLGYAVLVAEGSAVVMSLIQTHRVEAIVGVSCLGVLERAFPYMEAAAIPGVAIPLLQDDCVETTVDLDWVRDYIHLSSSDATRRLDLAVLRDEVEGWFAPESLREIMGAPSGKTEEIAREWLGRGGKRWRPFLTAAAFEAFRTSDAASFPDDLKKAAVAIECFHKASLIHDDIEDNDTERYGVQTLHEEHGVAVALNTGDLLIGEGYRLIASTTLPADRKAAMLLAASEGQRRLCRGQGAELCWMRSPAPLSRAEVLEIFQFKTAPAFEVALRLAVLFAGCEAHEEVTAILSSYSDALGVAYQIRDDIDDFDAGIHGRAGDFARQRPSLLLAIAHERAKDAIRQVTENLWCRRDAGVSVTEARELFIKLKAEERARILLESHKEAAVRALTELENPNLKGLLRRIIGKIFNETEIKGWCREVEQENAAKATKSAP